jgi:hypothetical protein
MGEKDYSFVVEKKSVSEMKRTNNNAPEYGVKHTKTQIKLGSSPVKEVGGILLKWDLKFPFKYEKGSMIPSTPDILKGKGEILSIWDSFSNKYINNEIFTLIIDDLNKIVIYGKASFVLTIGSIRMDQKSIEYIPALSVNLIAKVDKKISHTVFPLENGVENLNSTKIKIINDLEKRETRKDLSEMTVERREAKIARRLHNVMRGIVGCGLFPDNHPIIKAYRSENWIELEKLIGNRSAKEIIKARKNASQIKEVKSVVIPKKIRLY